MALYPARRRLRRLLPRPLALAIRARWLVWQTTSGRTHQETDVDVLPQVIRTTDVCWDIGANIGLYCIALAPLAASIEAFEPVPHNLAILGEVVRRLNLPTVAVHKLAVSDTSGHSRMTVPTEGFYGGYYLATLSDGGDLLVQTGTIDQLVADGLPRPDFVKVDVEGAEMSVVRGADTLISTAPPIWLIETFEDTLIPYLRGRGYRCYLRIGPERLEEVEARDPHQRNYWFFPSGRLPDQATP